MLAANFYARDAKTVAKDVLGKHLVVANGDALKRGRIVETEAYLGQEDLACHASKGRTKRTEVIFGPPGHAYVYLIYGMYDLFNLVTDKVGSAHAVLIRAVEPLEGLEGKTDGPGKLTRTLGITRAHNKLSLCGPEIWLEDGPAPKNIKTTPRIGIDYAKEWKDAPLRFFDGDSKFVSKPR